LSDAEASGQIVCEATNVTKRFQRPDGSEVIIVDNFSTRIQRGDRIGLIGPNGAGKSTLLKLLTGQTTPDSGTIKLGTNLLPLYLDQRRTVFDLDKTLWQTLAPGGGDSIMVRGQQRHVVAYLRDFLFSDKQATMTVRTLSGGERARLMLARLFAQPSNLIVLDEPTNDLDMDTLDLLQEVLFDYDGTLLLVSHDRDFLDRLVTSIIAVEGDGDVAEYPGGYSDYLLQRPGKPKAEAKVPKKPAGDAAPATAPRAPIRLASKEQRELDDLPGRLATLEKEIQVIETALADPALYAKDAQKFAKASELLAAKKSALSDAEQRWLELEEKRAALAAG
jgi:ATP-binding cassette subfamily F protein uup